MLRRVYNRVIALSETAAAPWWLFAVAFAEASVFPIPPDVMLIPMALAQPRRAFRYAGIATIGSVLGGMVGYLIGYALLARLAQPIIDAYGEHAAFAAFQAGFARYGVWVILVKGLTPIPYKIVTIAAGAAAFNFPLFVGASVVTRGARFFLLAVLLRRFGARVRDFVERRLALVTSLVAVGIVGGFLVLKFA